MENLKKIIMLIGLPGSGKTYWVNEYKKNNRCNVINFDNYLDENGKYEDIRSIFKKNIFYESYYNTIVLDGLFLTNEQRHKVLENVISHYYYCEHRIEIDYEVWNNDIESCLYNDQFRHRMKSAEITIKNSVYEPVDKNATVEFLKLSEQIKSNDNLRYSEPIDLNIIVNEHKVCKYNKIDIFKSEYGNNEDNTIMCSESWSGGGVYGNCWNHDMCNIDSESPIDFVEFDKLILNIYPNILFSEYKNIRNKCVSIQSHTEYGYYGSSETRICWRCDLIKLYEELNKLNKI